jgi:hypothetical protein
MYYDRSVSPPPPMPSPQLVPTPLPSPTPCRSRTVSHSRSQIRHEPIPITPSLIGRTHFDRALTVSKSCDHLYERAYPSVWPDTDDFGSSSNEGTECGSESDGNASPFSTQRSLQFHTPPRSPRSSTRKHSNQFPSVGRPYHSPPPSPTIAHRPPPVPIVALSGTDKKPTLHSPSPRRAYIHFPSLSITSSILSSEKSKPVPAPRKKKSLTCLRIFSLLNSSQPVVANTGAVTTI